MDYRKITSKNSPQYKLQQSDTIYTDDEGFRRVGDRFVVAIGTYYADSIGTYLTVELDGSKEFEAIVGDIKDNKHTDSTNRQHTIDGSVIEFIVDTKKMDNLSRKMGDMSYAKSANLSGDIVNIIVFED